MYAPTIYKYYTDVIKYQDTVNFKSLFYSILASSFPLSMYTLLLEANHISTIVF